MGYMSKIPSSRCGTCRQSCSMTRLERAARWSKLGETETWNSPASLIRFLLAAVGAAERQIRADPASGFGHSFEDFLLLYPS